MFPVIFKIGGFELHTYGVMLAIAFAVAVYIALKRVQRYGFTFVQFYDISMVIIVAAIVGSRVAYVILHMDEFQGRWWDTINPFQSTGEIGLSGLGGVILAVPAVLIYVRAKKLHLGKVVDVIAPSLAIGTAIGRVGCFLNGCCFGKPCDLPWAVHFPEGSFAHYAYHGAPIHPTQLYAIIYCLLIFLILTKTERVKPFHGFNFALFMILYGVFRFLNEFLRYYEGSEAGLNLLKITEVNITFSQISCLALILAGIVIILLTKRSSNLDAE